VFCWGSCADTLVVWSCPCTNRSTHYCTFTHIQKLYNTTGPLFDLLSLFWKAKIQPTPSLNIIPWGIYSFLVHLGLSSPSSFHVLQTSLSFLVVPRPSSFLFLPRPSSSFIVLPRPSSFLLPRPSSLFLLPRPSLSLLVLPSSSSFLLPCHSSSFLVLVLVLLFLLPFLSDFGGLYQQST
jgi:hypothetical protein